MNTDLKHYVRVYDLLDNEQCDIVMNELDSVPFERHQFKHYDGSLQASDMDPEFYTSEKGHITKETYNLIMDRYYDCLTNYLQHDINLPWYRGWNGYTPPKFNWYKSNTEMKNHCDHIWDIFTGKIRGIPIISMIALINDNFSGGEFVMFDTEVYKLKKGQVIIFPSIFLFPHKVNPVTNGERISMVSWVF